jgi:hypothetical protein
MLDSYPFRGVSEALTWRYIDSTQRLVRQATPLVASGDPMHPNSTPPCASPSSDS